MQSRDFLNCHQLFTYVVPVNYNLLEGKDYAFFGPISPAASAEGGTELVPKIYSLHE